VAPFVFSTTPAGALLVAAYLVVSILDDVAFLIAERTSAGFGVFGVPVRSNHWLLFVAFDLVITNDRPRCNVKHHLPKGQRFTH
jgi:hypothetical protein